MKRYMLRPVALAGAVAAMLAVTVILTRTHATFPMSGIGSLKCYTTAGLEKAC
jgi:uncharacterized membrane protein